MNNKKKWIAWTVALLLVTNILTAVISNKVSFSLPNGRVIITRDDYNEIMKFKKLFLVEDRLYKYYDGKIESDALVEGAVKGMTDSLKDPYTVFMNKKEFQDFNTQTEGTYTGLGIQVGVKDDKITVIAPFDNSPAKKAGIISGDVIEKVNNITVSGKDLEKAINMMKIGEEGSKVKLSINRSGKKRFDVNVERAKITMTTVKGEMLPYDIGYIQISMFDENTGKNFNKILKQLEDKKMRGLILDLRGNPGGLLNECVDVVSNFIKKDKVIVYTIDKYKNKKEYTSNGGSAIGLPLVVLTDEGTASASEIVSGAIRDYKAGTLVGVKTFGKGVVQTLLDTGDGTALKVTISKYYTPNGENIHHKGIKPNIEVKYPEKLKEKAYSRSQDPQFNKALEVIKDMMN